MLVAVISDTHLPRGSRVLPAACVERLRAADLILHAGDLTSVAFLDELRAFGPPVQAVHGNMDEPALRETLPQELVVAAGEARIGIVHIPGLAAGREARLAARFPGCDAVIYGHTHIPQVDRVGGIWILNPGSPTERRRAPAHSMIELRVAHREIEPKLVLLS
jgi:putative phosphoesterase